MKTSFWIVLMGAAIAVGCSDSENTGSTPPPDEGGTQTDAPGPQADASVDMSSAPDSGASDSSRVDGFIDIFDAFPIPDGPLSDCVSCIRDRCGQQVNQCVNNAVCRAGLLCTFTTCLANGMPDQACVLNCFMGDPLAALTAVGALTCINSSCGATCMAGFEGGMMLDANTMSDVSSPPDGATPPETGAADGAGPESSASDATPPSDASGSGD
jgi:hypothetical protein